jgi:hypothetical protein
MAAGRARPGLQSDAPIGLRDDAPVPPSSSLQPPEARLGNSSTAEAQLSAGSARGKQPKPRAKWAHPMEFTVACIGYAVGLGNFWRFPALCFNNGGGAFLVPYAIVLLLIGIPLFLLELGMGQRFQLGGGEIWQRVHPMLKGVGIASTIGTFIVCCYYNVVVAWSLWYLFKGMASPLPWDNRFGGALQFWEVDTLHCRASANVSCSWDADTRWPQRPGLAHPGPFVWPLVGCLALAWLLVWLCVVKGVQSAGNVAWFTALFPYAVLIIMLVRGLTLEGVAEATHSRPMVSTPHFPLYLSPPALFIGIFPHPPFLSVFVPTRPFYQYLSPPAVFIGICPHPPFLSVFVPTRPFYRFCPHPPFLSFFVPTRPFYRFLSPPAHFIGRFGWSPLLPDPSLLTWSLSSNSSPSPPSFPRPRHLILALHPPAPPYPHPQTP